MAHVAHQGLGRREPHLGQRRPDHAGVGQVVDVLGRGPEVGELRPRRRPAQLGGEPALQVVLDGLDVVVGPGLDLLDGGGVGLAEGRRPSPAGRRVGLRQRAELGHAGPAGQVHEPGHLDGEAFPDEGRLGEGGGVRLHLPAVAAVEGRKRPQPPLGRREGPPRGLAVPAAVLS